MTILLVDDNQVNLFVIEKILKGAGYDNCVSLTSAHALFDYLNLDDKNSKTNSVDLILLDIMMPEIDGIEACRRIQQVERLKHIPIIFVTALEDSSKLVEALDAGGTDYVTKPINKVELLARMRVALRLKAEIDWHTEHEKKIQTELDLATHVQQNLLSPPLREKDIQMEVSYYPSFKLAGDMYYWHKIDEHRYGIILFDMMGHGISASLVCMFISSVLREAIKSLIDPEQVITELNRYMELLHSEKDEIPYYFTAIYLVIDTEAKTVEYVNAGHPEGYMLVDEHTLVPLQRGSCPVGFFEEMDVQKSVVSFENDVQILLFTDGALESMGPCENESALRLQQLTEQKWTNPQAFMNEIFSEEQKLNQPDDMCVLMIQAQAQ
ncbi:MULTISPECIES: SpoIIE family protein phosphatase [Priestia]|uniref:SpoIIE family protein phosphatase n=1 Tax=Priestia TaxID=2800373 RepID=UPI001CD5943B|nr:MULTISPECIES: fused response regulator/phosphatase [Priestia]MCA1049046.1 fused response regulator/phosphatase [Priestia aryabhattai]MEB4855788.1 fused response regulator/phosphatase [Priestia megaterium]